MDLSLGETETLVVRATRGFGLSWGLAQEAGRAASLLATLGFPAVTLFADLFRLSAGLGYAERRPVISHGRWTAAGPALCPVVLGSAISDRCADLLVPNASPITTGPVYCPLIVVAMLLPSTTSLDEPVHCQWHGVDVWLVRGQLLSRQSGAPSASGSVGQLTLGCDGADEHAAVLTPAEHTRSQTRRDHYEALLSLARLTYVPAGTEQGSIDNRIQAD